QDQSEHQPRQRPKTVARQARFLEKYLMTPSATRAAARADLPRGTIYMWRHVNAEFKAAFDQIAAEHARRRDMKRITRRLGHLPVLEWDLPIKSIAWAPSP
ncbi:MAG: hypothetical protein Q8L22_13110, partial [Reyranella sp.]|nr:hypothetical protein [Reyranella sp.]